LTNYFNANADTSELYIDLQAKAAAMGFDSIESANKEMDLFIHGPDGSETQLDAKYRRGGLKVKLPVPYLVSIASVNGGALDDLNPAASVEGSTGKPRHRIVGMKLYMRVELRNQFQELAWPPRGKIFGGVSCHLFLSSEADWMRVPSAFVTPTREQAQIKVIDIYGLRLTIKGDEAHGMHLFSAVKFLQASTNMVVLWLSVRIIVYYFVTQCYGATSSKWRRAASRNIETHVLLNRHSTDRIRKRHEVEAQARDIVLALGRHLASDADVPVVGSAERSPVSRNKYTKKEQMLMFGQLDKDADGAVTEDELKDYLRGKNVKFAQLTMDCVMHQLDLNGNSTFELKEFQKSIGRALVEKKFHSPQVAEGAWHGCCCRCFSGEARAEKHDGVGTVDNEDVALAVKRVERSSISSQKGTSMFLNTELESLGIEDESITEANRVHAENDSRDDADVGPDGAAAVHHHHHHPHHPHHSAEDGLSSSSEEEEEGEGEEGEGEKERGGGSSKAEEGEET
jgi:hypothetical protein